MSQTFFDPAGMTESNSKLENEKTENEVKDLFGRLTNRRTKIIIFLTVLIITATSAFITLYFKSASNGKSVSYTHLTLPTKA